MGEAIYIVIDLRRHHDLEIKDMEQPLLIHRPKRKKVKESIPSRPEEVKYYRKWLLNIHAYNL